MEKLIFRLLGRQMQRPQAELYRLVLMLAVSLVAGAVQVILSLFFAAVRCPPLFASHLAGVFVSGFCVFLLMRGHMDLGEALLLVMMMASSALTLWMLGDGSYPLLYQYMALLILMVAPFVRKQVTVVFCVLLPLLMVGSFLLDQWHTPWYDLGSAGQLLALLNILICALGTAVLISLERVVRTTVVHYQQARLQELQTQAYLDPLTNLYNRRYAEVYFGRLREDPLRGDISVAMADIDDFKRINDTHGHDAGDAVLVSIARHFTGGIRKTDLVFRWGGEEFLLLLHNASTEDTRRILDTLRQRIEQATTHHEEKHILCTVSIGISSFDPMNVQDCLEACDRLLYECKRSGKNQVRI